jgi:hypothetical protein
MNTTIINNRKRSKELIAEFENKYAVNWVFKVNECFKDALDIKIGERKILGKATLVWTQGHIYCFQKGDTILDHECKVNEKWSESLKHINYCLRVETAVPCTIRALGEEEILESTITEDEELEKKYKQKKKYTLDHGNIKFNVLIPNQEKTALKIKETIECSQVEFVNILKNGFQNVECETNQFELSFS